MANPLNRRLAKLEDAWDRKLSAMDLRLFGEEPPFQVRMNEKDAFRRYLDDEANGKLFSDRESNGGWRPDGDMDRYVAWGERMKAKFAPQMLLNDTVGKAAIASGLPWNPNMLDQQQNQDDAEQHAPAPGIDDLFSQEPQEPSL